MGDSYCAGAGATNKSKSWAQLFSSSHGLFTINLCRGGTGIVNEGIGRVSCGIDYCGTYRFNLVLANLRTAPEYILISGGRNDFGTSLREVRAEFTNLIHYIQSKFPQARVYVISPFWDSSAYPEIGLRYQKIEQSISNLLDVEYILGANKILRDIPSSITSDGVHPNDAGHDAIYRWLYSKVDLGKRSLSPP